MGKTSWARALGDHFYCNNMFNVSELDPTKRYCVFDDIRLTNINYWHWKPWFGGQHEFTVTDKYRKKRRFRWGKPVIWLCNPASDPRKVDIPYDEKEWLEECCYFVEINNTMY